MSVFSIKVAGYTFEAETAYEYSYTMCRPFIVQDQPDFHVKVFPKDIAYEKAMDTPVSTESSDRIDSLYECLALLRIISETLIDRDVLLIHGAAVALDQSGYLFTGKSGTGKTTLVCKWMMHRPDLVIINGDKPFIRVDKTPMICSSPWTGKEGIFTNISRPLNAILMLERGAENAISRVSVSDALPTLLQSVYLPEDPLKKCKVIGLINRLTEKVDLFKYQINNLKDDGFHVAYNALVKGQT